MHRPDASTLPRTIMSECCSNCPAGALKATSPSSLDGRAGVEKQDKILCT